MQKLGSFKGMVKKNIKDKEYRCNCGFLGAISTKNTYNILGRQNLPENRGKVEVKKLE